MLHSIYKWFFSLCSPVLVFYECSMSSCSLLLIRNDQDQKTRPAIWQWRLWFRLRSDRQLMVASRALLKWRYGSSLLIIIIVKCFQSTILDLLPECFCSVCADFIIDRSTCMLKKGCYLSWRITTHGRDGSVVLGTEFKSKWEIAIIIRSSLIISGPCLEIWLSYFGFSSLSV